MRRTSAVSPPRRAFTLASLGLESGRYVLFAKMDNRFAQPEAAIAALERLIDAMLASRHPKDWFRTHFNFGLIGYIRGLPRLLPCAMGSESFLLDPYGEIQPCNVMDRTMGNFKQRDFLDIWRDPEAEDIRRCVGACANRCWMIGSAADPIKRNQPAAVR